MSPEEIKQLRKDLNLSARQLATSIKAETEDVWAWETGERFPTKRFVTRMLALKKPPPKPASTPSVKSAPPKTPRAPGSEAGLARLADPELWEVVRKLAQHPALFESVRKLAQGYPDPAAPAARPAGVPPDAEE